MINPAVIVQPKSELMKWRSLRLESYILDGIYEPMWYYYDSCLMDHKDIAVYVLNQEERVELIDSKADTTIQNGARGEMSQMIAEFWSGHEFFRIGIKQREPGESYSIGIACPNQGWEYHSIYNALMYASGSYGDIVKAVNRLTAITKEICACDYEPQWLTIQNGKDEMRNGSND